MMYMEINCGPSSFNYSISQLLCCDDGLAGHSYYQGRIQGYQVRFLLFLILSQMNIKALFHILLFLKKELSTLFSISALH